MKPHTPDASLDGFFHFDTEDASDWKLPPVKEWKPKEPRDDFWIIPVLVVVLFTVLAVLS